MENKNTLLVSDFVGVGKVALSTMIPILSSMGARLNYLPTAVVSNNFAYGEAALEDLTGFMESSKNAWKKHGFEFDIISTGIIMNKTQVEIVKEIISWHKEKPLVIVDPIMGDNGEIYPGLAGGIVEASREAILIGDIVIPNLTELSLILGEEYPEEMTDEIIKNWLGKLIEKEVKAAIITSVNIGGNYYVYGYDEDKKIFRVEFRYIPLQAGGTGDLFTSLMIGFIEKGYSIKRSIESGTKILTSIMEQEYERIKKEFVEDIDIERYLGEIQKELG